MNNEELKSAKLTIKKGFDLFKPHPPFIYSRACALCEPMCCEVCKGCLFNIGKLICKYRKATYSEARTDRLTKAFERAEKLKGAKK